MKFALIPVKDLSKAKERLSSIMSQEERTALAYAMLEDVLNAIKGAELLDRFYVVTLDEKAMEIAQKAGAEITEEREQKDESASVDYASKVCKDLGAESVLVLPGDVPLVTSRDIDFVLEKEKLPPSVVLVPARDKMGTNAILRNPPDVIPSRFGHDSFRKHIEESKKKNISYTTYEVPGIALDIDEPQDLEYFLLKKSDTQTYTELARIGIIDKT